MDVFTPEKRSQVMARIRGRDTKPELYVRRALHRAGLRYSLRRRELPGRPDIVLPALRSVVFVHGCFWHGHNGCKYAAVPKSNAEFWSGKIAGTKERDSRAENALRRDGWQVSTVWECELAGEAVPRLVSELLSRRDSLRGGRTAE